MLMMLTALKNNVNLVYLITYQQSQRYAILNNTKNNDKRSGV